MLIHLMLLKLHLTIGRSISLSFFESFFVDWQDRLCADHDVGTASSLDASELLKELLVVHLKLIVCYHIDLFLQIRMTNHGARRLIRLDASTLDSISPMTLMLKC